MPEMRPVPGGSTRTPRCVEVQSLIRRRKYNATAASGRSTRPGHRYPGSTVMRRPKGDFDSERALAHAVYVPPGNALTSMMLARHPWRPMGLLVYFVDKLRRASGGGCIIRLGSITVGGSSQDGGVSRTKLPGWVTLPRYPGLRWEATPGVSAQGSTMPWVEFIAWTC